MKTKLTALFLMLFFATACLANETAEYLQDISVTIGAGMSQGSGVLYQRDGKTFVWTAGHVVDGLRFEKQVTDPATGTRRTVVEFKDAMVIKHIIEDGRTVGKTEWNALVIKYSEKEDLALLKIRSKNFVTKGSVQFYLEEKPPSIGSDLWHCGSLLGEMGSNSITSGVISQHGRLIDQIVYDQTTVTAFPGSSGGGVYLKDGKYVGMLVRGAGEQFNLIVPVRRMVRWAKEAGVYWAMVESEPMPEDFSTIRIEDIGVKFERNAASQKDFPYLIKILEEAVFIEAP